MPGGGSGGQTSTTSSAYPPQYNALLDTVAQKAQDVANQPLQQYQGQQVADLSPDTLNAMQLARNSVGSTDGINQQALDSLNQYAGYSGLGTGIQALASQGNPQNYSDTATVSPLVNNALPALNSSSAAYTQGLLGQYGANQTVPDVIQNYLNPYTNNVVNDLATQGSKNLFQNILPGINSTFTGGGAFGGSRNSEFMSRAINDANQSILQAQNSALQSGYNNATTAAQSDLSRLTGTAENVGSQYAGDLSRNISGTQTLAGILSGAGDADSARGISTANTLTGLASQDANNALTASGALQNYGTNIYNQNLKDASVLEGLGTTEQQQQQNEINANMAQFNQAVNYPQQQLQTLESPLQTIKIPETTTTTTSDSGGGFGDILGGLIGLGSTAAKAGAFGPAAVAVARGGSIPAYAVGGPVSPLAATWNAPQHTGNLMRKQIGRAVYAGRSPLMKARGGEVSGYWGQDAIGSPDYSDQEQLGRTDKKQMYTGDYGDGGMQIYNPSNPDKNEIRDQFYIDQKRVLPSREFRKGGNVSPLMRGYADGGDIGDDDDLWKQLHEMLGSDPQAMSSGAVSIDPEIAHLAQTADSVPSDASDQQDSSPDTAQPAPQPVAPPQQQLSPLLAGSGAPGPVPFRQTQIGQQSPLSAQSQQPVPQPPSPQDVKTAQIQALQQSTDDVKRSEMLKTGLPTTLADFQAKAAKNLADLQKDKWADAGLSAAAGMLSTHGSSWNKLGAGFGAAGKSFDENRAEQIAGYSKLADQNIKDADWKQQVAMTRATNGQNAVGNKSNYTKAEAAQKLLDSGTLKANDPRIPALQKVVSDYASGSTSEDGSVATPGGGSTPKANLTNALNDAKNAIQQGAPRDAVVQRLKQMGIDPGDL